MLPIPAFVALVLGYLALRSFLSEGRPCLVAFLGVCAGQSLLVALVGGYGLEGLRPVLPVTATIVPALAWVTFQDALVHRRPSRALLVHGAAPAFALFCVIFAAETTDVIVPLVFVGYGGAILWRLRAASDMPLARLEAGQVPALLWRALGWALIGSALCDVLIALAFMTGHPEWTGWLIAISSSLVLLLVGVLSGNPAAAGASVEEATPPEAPPPAPQTSAEDLEIVETLKAFLSREPLHLDPNLTLARLARRVHVPEKRLSMAINRATGANVSRYINGWRIRHACARIDAGASVTEAMLDSGFNTKSNFNRAFLHETGVPPSQWRSDPDRGCTVTPLPDASRRA